MQQRRYRPGDVLDDYCPRERRITDHAIVAMIDDDIKQTRCVVCDAEHQYKDGKIPAQRRKKPQPALFAQVLEGLQGPQPAGRLSPQPDTDSDPDPDVLTSDETVAHSVAAVAAMPAARNVEDAVYAEAAPPPGAQESFSDEPRVGGDDRPWRRLIRAALPRPEGQQPQPARQMPEFTVRQPNSRGPRHARRRGGHAGAGGVQGPMRFGRDGQGQGRDGQGQGQGQGPRQHNGRRRRRGKKQ